MRITALPSSLSFLHRVCIALQLNLPLSAPAYIFKPLHCPSLIDWSCNKVHSETEKAGNETET